MHAVVPFDVSVAQFFKTPIGKAGGNREFSQPSFRRHMDAVGSRVPDHETNRGTWSGDGAQVDKYATEISEISRDHRVVGFFATLGKANLGEPLADNGELGMNRSQDGLAEQFGEIEAFRSGVL